MGNEQGKRRIENKPKIGSSTLNIKLDLFTLRSYNTVKNYDDIPDSTFLITKLHVRLLGARGVGKSSLVSRYLHNQTKSTILDEERINHNFQSTTIIVEGVELNLKFIYTDYSDESSSDIQRTGFHFVVFDISNRESFVIAQKIVNLLYNSTLSHYGFTKYIVLLANKKEKADHAQVSTNEIEDFTKRFNVEFRSVSALYDSQWAVADVFNSQIRLYVQHRLKDVEDKKKKHFEYIEQQRDKARQFGVVSTLGSTYFQDVQR